eukprot:gb/GECH01006908.1/.p1 GENE.gb/GECH01006908.1/~~gb/GECH01006908.1/.p1  ORF type:complete len:247 (+),score=40.24 gb/GECH01006908.1/:1-741(+)
MTSFNIIFEKGRFRTHQENLTKQSNGINQQEINDIISGCNRVYVPEYRWAWFKRYTGMGVMCLIVVVITTFNITIFAIKISSAYWFSLGLSLVLLLSIPVINAFSKRKKNQTLLNGQYRLRQHIYNKNSEYKSKEISFCLHVEQQCNGYFICSHTKDKMWIQVQDMCHEEQLCTTGGKTPPPCGDCDNDCYFDSPCSSQSGSSSFADNTQFGWSIYNSNNNSVYSQQSKNQQEYYTNPYSKYSNET